MTRQLTDFLQNSYTSYHAVENTRELLLANEFVKLTETEDWEICENGKYFVEREGAIIAFCVGSLDQFNFKIVSSHTDSPALKIKENAVIKSECYEKLNVEKYLISKRASGMISVSKTRPDLSREISTLRSPPISSSTCVLLIFTFLITILLYYNTVRVTKVLQRCYKHQQK